MSKQKEDVLLMVKHVRYKKVDGTLYVNSGRLAWRNQTSDSFRISAAFEDIRVQRISPDQKEKVQLQLLMHNGESFTFQFADPVGRFKQLEMRNSVKEMLQRLLPKFKDKAQSELKEKVRLLESNPDLLALYKELVVTGILSSDEFWARPEFSSSNFNTSKETQAMQRKSQSNTSAPGSTQSTNTTAAHSAETNTTGQISRSFQLDDRPQTVGVPSYLLSDIKPEADGANGIKYNLTHETIDAIFRAYPTVRQRHRELVPDKLSEADFWIKFFQSHYFHRDRVQLPKEDIFADCTTLDERQLQNELRRSRRNRVTAHLDLDGLSDHDLGAGYGTEPDLNPAARSADLATNKSTESFSNLSANQLLLRRFNYHSILVLKSLGSSDIASGLASVTPEEQLTQATTTEPTRATSLKRRIYAPELADDPEPPLFPLELASVTDYLEGPTSKEPNAPFGRLASTQNSSSLTRSYTQSTSIANAADASARCKNAMRLAYAGAGRRPRGSLLSTVDAQLALADVSPGGCLVGGKGADELKTSRSCDRTDAVDSSGCRGVDGGRLGSGSSGSRRSTQHPDDVDRGPALLNAEQTRELSLLYASASELLRHFWACFPVTSPGLAEKLDRIASSLTRFRVSKVAHFAASLDPTSAASGNNVVTTASGSAGGVGSAVVTTGSSKASTDSSSVAGDTGSRGGYRSRVTSHLESMLDAAQQKYTEWKSRKRRL